MSVPENLKEINRRSGEILRIAVNLDSNLEWFLWSYFCPNSGKELFFRDSVLSKMNFDRKAGLFKEICKEEKLDQTKIKNISDDISFVQEIRNKVGHNELVIEDFRKEIIRLHPRKRMVTRAEMIEITDELVKEVGDRTLHAIQGIVDMFKEIENKSKYMPSNEPSFK